MIRTSVQRSRKYRYCENVYGHDIRIKPGDTYVRHVASPSHAGITPDAWTTYIECAECLANRTPGDTFGIALDVPAGDPQ